MTSKNSIQIKEKQVNELIDQMKKSKTFMIVSIVGLPSKQFQEIKKTIREDAIVKITRKNIVTRAVKKFGKETILPLLNHISSDIAFVLSQKDGYELAGILFDKKTKVFAKTGQIAPANIEVKAGPTSLVPGPAISELSALGIKISVEDGKIAIKEPKVVVKEGAVISEAVASLLQKLNIQPFNVGLNPVVIYDIQKEKIYTNIKIDPEETTKTIKYAAVKALGFAQKIGYYSRETIDYFLVKANSEAKALEKATRGSQ